VERDSGIEPIFVAGCGRSGTTLLAAMLAAQAGVVAPPEAQFLSEGMDRARGGHRFDLDALAAEIAASWRYQIWDLPPDLPTRLAGECSRPAELMAGIAAAFASANGRGDARRWIDHTPINIAFAPMLLAEFEAAPMIHVVRDPRAVVASVLPLDWGPASAREGARWWLRMLGFGLAAEAAFPERVTRVRYEDLVREPEATLRDLCARIGLAYDGRRQRTGAELPAYTRSQHALVGRPPDPSRIDAWRWALDHQQLATIERELREAPAMLGYPSAAPATAVGNRSALEFATTSLLTARQHLRHRARIRQALRASD
jgi:hypothetical protein